MFQLAVALKLLYYKILILIHKVKEPVGLWASSLLSYLNVDIDSVPFL